MTEHATPYRSEEALWTTALMSGAAQPHILRGDAPVLSLYLDPAKDPSFRSLGAETPSRLAGMQQWQKHGGCVRTPRRRAQRRVPGLRARRCLRWLAVRG